MKVQYSKLKKWQIYEIDWVDSMSVSGWKFEDEVEILTKDEYLNHKTIGYFFRQTDKQIVMCASKSNDGEEKSNIREILCIPKVAIYNITILNSPKT